MKKTKKIVSVLMTTFLIFSTFLGITSSNVKAVNLPVTKADLYSKGEVVLFDYDQIGIGVEVIVYQKDGKEYPAYCINKGRPGVTQEHTYSVNINQYLTNNGIWKAIVNGYPFKTPAELGCQTMQEAYAATKMAVYDAMYHYDLNKFTVHKDLASNQRVVAAIKKIITAARNSSDSKIAAILKIKEETQEWKTDENKPTYVSKTYIISSSASYQTYQVNMKGENIATFKITNLQGKEQTTFNQGEKFKVMIPISELEEEGEFTLSASANLATMPILYGESPNPEWQNFAIIAGTYELADSTLKQKYYPNQTKIQIVKQDGDNQTALSDAVFHLYDLEHKLVHQEIRTDKNGNAYVNNLLPGTYYLKEIQAPEGYYGYDEDIKVEIKLNEKVVVTVQNYQEPQEEREEKPQEENHFSVGIKKETVTLPRTGF